MKFAVACTELALYKMLSNYDKVEQNLEAFKRDWGQLGMSLMFDSWI